MMVEYNFHTVVIRISEHLKLRIRIRKIPVAMARRIVSESQEIYFDNETNHWIAVAEGSYAGKLRPMVAVFDRVEDDVEVITVYPTERDDIIVRQEKGRWVYEKQKN